MSNDDKLDADAEVGGKDIAAQVRRFDRVNAILVRAINRYQQIITDIGTPSSDPTVQAALQRIVASAGAVAGTPIPSAPAGTSATADGIIVKVVRNPGPQQDPAVQATVGLVQSVAQQLSTGVGTPVGGVP